MIHSDIMSDDKTVICKNRLTGESKEVSAEKLFFRPSAYGVIIQDGKVLLNPAWDGYDFPGGGIDKGESIRGGLLREIKEETGLDVTPGPLVYVGEDFFIANYKANTYFHALVYYFACTDPKGEISTDGFMGYEKEYLKKSEWVPLERVRELKFYNPVGSSALIQKVLAGQYTVTL